MDQFRLQCFVALAEELHFQRAAERCHISQPAMSQQIRTLERTLGVQLAHRTKRTVALTAAGEAFLTETRRSLAQLDHAASVAQRTDRGAIGQLRVGSTSPALYVLLPEALQRFRRALPGVEVQVHQLTTAEQEHALRSGALDVGLVHPPLDSSGLTTHEVARPEFWVAMPTGHRLAERELLVLEDLAEEGFVMFPRQVGPQLYDAILSLCRAAGFSLRITTEAYPAQSIIALVAAGAGLGFIASQVQRLERPGVVYRRIEGPRPELAIGVAHPRDTTSPTVRAFVAAAREAGSGIV